MDLKNIDRILARENLKVLIAKLQQHYNGLSYEIEPLRQRWDRPAGIASAESPLPESGSDQQGEQV
jgi:hypothetical protein